MLLAKESNMIPGILMGSLGDVHVYENHIDGANEQLSREPKKLPVLVLPNFTSIWDWNYMDFALLEYDSHPKIEFSIAV